MNKDQNRDQGISKDQKRDQSKVGTGSEKGRDKESTGQYMGDKKREDEGQADHSRGQVQQNRGDRQQDR